MKIRAGFVSNSSSSSFLIYGVKFPDDKEHEAIIEKLCADGLETHGAPPFQDAEHVGLCLSKIGMDETRRQFQERVDEILRRNGVDQEARIYQEGWYDG